MKVTFLYSRMTGRGVILKHLARIETMLHERFDTVKMLETTSFEHLQESIREASVDSDVLAFSGGDGTYHLVVNVLMQCPRKPTLLYVPGGTINDSGRNFKIPGNYKKAIRVFDQNNIEKFDICKVNDEYFFYICAVGKFAPIPYTTKREYKKRLGKIPYYWIALKEAFSRHKNINVVINIDGQEHEHVTPFVLVLNGRTAAGFPINRKADLNDGKFDLFLAKPGPFGGLLQYLFRMRKIPHYLVSKLTIKTDSLDPWCLDGERGMHGDISIESIPGALSIYSNRRKKS